MQGSREFSRFEYGGTLFLCTRFVNRFELKWALTSTLISLKLRPLLSVQKEILMRFPRRLILYVNHSLFRVFNNNVISHPTNRRVVYGLLGIFLITISIAKAVNQLR